MFESIKKKLAEYVVRKNIANVETIHQPFNQVLSKSISFLVIMPDNDEDFYHSMNIIRYLEIHKKNVTIFAKDHKINLIPDKHKLRFIENNISDITRLGLPSKAMREKLSKLEYQVIMDLNRQENLFSSMVANLIRSRVRVGFSKPGADKYYNFHFAFDEPLAEISYKNFLNCLQMF